MNKMMIVFGLMFVLCLSFSYGLTTNSTEFDDGGSSFNITSNTTKYITLPINSSIESTNITVKGLNTTTTRYCYQESANVSTSCGGLDTGVYASSGDWDTTYTWNRVIDENWGNFGRYKNADDIAYGYINYTKPFGALNTSLWEVDTTYSGFSRQNKSIPNQCWIAYKNKIVLRVMSEGALPTGYGFYCHNSTDWVEILRQEHGSAGIKEEAMYWGIGDYPENVLLKVNNTIVFNHTGNLTGTNTSIDFTSELETCNNDVASCSFEFSASTWGKLEISNLFVQYNKTRLAVLNIVSPTQITGSVNTGGDYTQLINITNTGNYNANATNITFVTVSESSTPNYNSSISHNCGDIQNGTSITCNVTFSSLNQNPESDEKLKVKAIGTDNNDWVYSPGIDVDITVTAGTGGGGGGGAEYTRCNWKIYRPYNLKINLFGPPGKETGTTQITIYNNETQEQDFVFSGENVDCTFKYNHINVKGSSYGDNKVKCIMPDDKLTEGKIVVSGSGCDSAINVKLISNKYGWLASLFTGEMGFGAALASYLVIIIVIVTIVVIW